MLAAMAAPADELPLSYGAPSKSAPELPRGSARPPPAPATALSLPVIPQDSAAAAAGAAKYGLAWAKAAVASARPWREFYDARLVRLPVFAEVTERVEKNVDAYRGNYEVLAVGWCAFALFMSLGRFLVAAVLLFGVERWVRFKVRAEGELSLAEKVFAGAMALCIVWATGVGTRVVESFAVGCAFMLLHAVLHVPPEIPDGQEMA
jgi:hypothetical protein